MFLKLLLPDRHAAPNIPPESQNHAGPFFKTSKTTTECVYMTGQQNTKHLPSWGSGLGSCNKRGPISTPAPWGLGLRVRTVAIILAGRARARREGPDLRAPCQLLLPCGGHRAIKEQGAFSGVRNFLLFVTKESLVTKTRHPGIWVMILPCTGDSRCGRSKHDQCIQHKFAKIQQ